MSYDLIIAGGGTSGSMAAIAAGRMGLKTLLVEANGFLGGTATGALVSPAMSTHFNDYISDLNEDIRNRLIETGDGKGNWFNPEMLKIVLEQLAVEAGVEIRYYAYLSGAKVEECNIKEIYIQSKSGREALKASFYIDATGDADLAVLSGASFEKGNNKGVNQPVSVRFTMSNIDVQSFSDYVRSLGQKEELDVNAFHTAHTLEGNLPLKPEFEKAIETGLLLEEDARYFQCFSVPGRSGELSFNCPEIFEPIDGTDSKQLSRAQIVGKQKIIRYLKFLRTLPGFDKAFLGQIAPMVGVRETRRIEGVYKLTGKDILSFKKFEDRIVSSNYPVDIHNMSEEEKKEIYALSEKVPKEQRYYDIPARVMFPKEINNLMVAGRCMSADFIAQSAIRIQNVVRAMGEAAAYIVYLAKEADTTIKNYDNNKFKILLKQKGFK